MRQLIVVSRRRDWPIELSGCEVITARQYLTESQWSTLRRARVFNLCRSYGYQTNGYYVSLLAAARGHRPLPAVGTLQDFKLPELLRSTNADLTRLIRTRLKALQSDRFFLSIYFGRNLAKRYDALSKALFNLYPAPMLRAEFVRVGEEWMIRRLAPLAYSDVPENHYDFMLDSARRYLAGHRPRPRTRQASRFDLAILANPEEAKPPSDEAALKRFERAAELIGFSVERLGPDEIGRLAEFDALFIRETTAVNHHTFRFARRATAEGLEVIDDPDSILRCTNKVYLAELLQHHKITAPRTLMVHRDNVADIEPALGLPVVLKQPDSAFSLGVVKASDGATLISTVKEMLKSSDLIVAQEYLPTDFDWRIGIIDGKPLYACRYHMARGHWQIINHAASRQREGAAETLAVEDAPARVIQTALKATALIGRGLYGVDLKEVGGRILVIEVNDNPSIDAGIEDAVLGDSLYQSIMETLMARVVQKKSLRGGVRV
jgi:glutathione synthase/RimK-type ligase-like ATP-grasp enzyme